MYTRPALEPTVIADLDTLLTALYVELTDRTSSGGSRARAGKPGCHRRRTGCLA